MFMIKFKTFINDLMVVFTDFKEKLMDGYEFYNNASLDSRSLKIERDKYLAFYQGIMFTMENIALKSLTSANK